MSVELKIKSKHLAFEPAIIRKEEYKLIDRMRQFREFHQVDGSKDPDYFLMQSEYYGLARHRTWDVKNEARATYLARAFIDGKTYSKTERRTEKRGPIFTKRILPRVVDMVAKYGAPQDRIHKYWNGTRQWYRPEEYNALIDKIYQWYYNT